MDLLKRHLHATVIFKAMNVNGTNKFQFVKLEMDAWTLIVVIMLLVELDQLDGDVLVTVAIQAMERPVKGTVQRFAMSLGIIAFVDLVI